MSRDASVTLDWADGTHTFKLGIAELVALEEACSLGCFEILTALGVGRWRVKQIGHVIRLGLIGGGMEPAKALTMVRDYVEARPPMENVMLARGVLNVALQGAPDDPPGEAAAAPETESA